jgi:hypothetical protein
MSSESAGVNLFSETRLFGEPFCVPHNWYIRLCHSISPAVYLYIIHSVQPQRPDHVPLYMFLAMAGRESKRT